MTPGARSQADCEPAPLGHFERNGLAVPCPRGYYQDKLGTKSENECIRCPEFGETHIAGATRRHDCLCGQGFLEDEDESCTETLDAHEVG